MKLPKGIDGKVFDEVFFTEHAIPRSSPIKHIKVDVHKQNVTLEEIRSRLAEAAKALGANAVMNFRYGQKLHSAWEVIRHLHWEMEYWHGEGDAVKI